jgi:hypothetical protein
MLDCDWSSDVCSSDLNDILNVYRDLRLKAGHQVIGMTLSRYWQEMGNREGDMRGAIDVAMRDGLMKSNLVGMDRYWSITADGAAYAHGPVTPESFFRLSPALGKLASSQTAGELHKAMCKLFSGQAPGLRYSSLRSAWGKNDENALLLGLDMLLKHRHASVDAADDPLITLNDAGQQFVRDETPRGLFGSLSRVLK